MKMQKHPNKWKVFYLVRLHREFFYLSSNLTEVQRDREYSI